MSKDKSESLAESVERQLPIAVDPETFKYALSIFESAASGQMSGSHIQRSDETGWHPNNLPMNRGTLAVLRETKHLDEDNRQALLFRIMRFHETVKAAAADARMTAHARITDARIEISDEFIDAYAGCRFCTVDERNHADLENLAESLEGKAAT